MTKVTRSKPYRVYIIESEAGWGQRVDETLHFETEEQATKYVDEFNAKNTEMEVPSWYMYAEYAGKIN